MCSVRHVAGMIRTEGMLKFRRSWFGMYRKWVEAQARGDLFLFAGMSIESHRVADPTAVCEGSVTAGARPSSALL